MVARGSREEKEGIEAEPRHGGQPGDGVPDPHHEQVAGHLHPAGRLQHHRLAPNRCGRRPECRQVVRLGELRGQVSIWQNTTLSLIARIEQSATVGRLPSHPL